MWRDLRTGDPWKRKNKNIDGLHLEKQVWHSFVNKLNSKGNDGLHLGSTCMQSIK
jgi:flagellar biosynthesis regulator FlaF